MGFRVFWTKDISPTDILAPCQKIFVNESTVDKTKRSFVGQMSVDERGFDRKAWHRFLTMRRKLKYDQTVFEKSRHSAQAHFYKTCNLIYTLE